jgi:hypothetical protein
LKKWMPTTRPGWEVAVEISEDGLRPDDAVEPPEEALLDVELLDDSLDDQVGVLDVRDVRGEGNPVDEVHLVGLGQLPPLDGAGSGVLDVLTAPLERLVVQLHTDDLEAVAGEDLGDARPHRAEADHTDAAEVTCGSHGPNHGMPIQRRAVR